MATLQRYAVIVTKAGTYVAKPVLAFSTISATRLTQRLVEVDPHFWDHALLGSTGENAPHAADGVLYFAVTGAHASHLLHLPRNAGDPRDPMLARFRKLLRQLSRFGSPHCRAQPEHGYAQPAT